MQLNDWCNAVMHALCMVVKKILLIVEINDLMDMEDLVDDFVTFYVAGKNEHS